jgi:serine/threonine protein phosphatase PrpC
MENPAATLHCPNTRCQAANPPSNKFCQKCRTPLLRRYLWAIGEGIEAYKPGDEIAGRYVLIHSSVILDTRPGMPPDTPQDVPQSIVPYLRLSPYGLHVPKVYGRLAGVDGRHPTEIWLLEEAPIYAGGLRQTKEAADAAGQLFPELTSVWKDASAVRQLNWLWQLANLWQSFSSEGVASSLLSPTLLRVEGPVVRLLELQLDRNQTPTLQQLGQVWSQLTAGVSPVIAEFFQQLCTQLRERQLRSSEQLVGLLDRAIKDCGRSQSRTYEVFTLTDAGPSRNHNEDACYPSSGHLTRPSPDASALAIVCDGIGGHEGGEVASHLAIETLRQRVEKLPNDPDNWNPATLTQELESAVCAANDVISEQNDSEHRSERQRMGTTLVMARSSAHELYITHVGDSRVYWITRNNCYQVTQDDDLASREERLGYALYRNAVQQPTSGSLVQALGMAPSTTLHPTVQRFVLDEDCVFLLCSDGLSDFDRVEQYWQSEILPILQGQIDLTTAGSRLIGVANTQNGHDNATVALVHCKVSSSRESGQTQLSVPELKSLFTPSVSSEPTVLASAASSQMKTQQLPAKTSTRRHWGLWLGILTLLGLSGVLASIFFGGFDRLISLVSSLGEEPQATSSAPPPTTPSPAESSQPSPSPIGTLEPQQVVQVVSSTTISSADQDVPLLLRRDRLPPQNQSAIGIIPAGSILQIVNKAPDGQQASWLQLRVCAPGTSSPQSQQPNPAAGIPPGSPQNQVGQSPGVPNPKSTSVAYRQVALGDSGWIRESELVSSINPTFTPTATQQNACAPPTPSVTSTPTPKSTQSP